MSRVKIFTDGTNFIEKFFSEDERLYSREEFIDLFKDTIETVNEKDLYTMEIDFDKYLVFKTKNDKYFVIKKNDNIYYIDPYQFLYEQYREWRKVTPYV